MHPPAFRPEQRLSDWPDCFLDLTCPACRKRAICPVALIRASHGDVSFAAVLPRLLCQVCRVRPAPVYLCASQHRTRCSGPPPDWALELVPPPSAAQNL